MREQGLHFGDESFQSITRTGTDNLTKTTKRHNTQITQSKKWPSAQQTHSQVPMLRHRTDRTWFSHLL